MSAFGIGLVGFVLLAAVYDLRERRIPNRLVASCGIVGLFASVAHGGGAGLADALSALALAGSLLFPAFALGWLGAGDVKLAGALAAWLGLTAVPRFLATAVVAGGVLSAALIALEIIRARKQRGRERDASGSRFAAVPYALAIGAGAIVTFATGGAR